MEHPRRKPTRLKDFDYSTDGAYFITICTQNRECVLSEILDSYEIRLSEYGKIAEEQIKLVQQRFTNVSIPQYVIMPNHIHLIIILNESGRAAKWAGGANTMFAHSPQTGAGRAAKWAGGASPSPTVSDVIRVLKSQTTRLCNCGGKLFQRSFHDHIIRNEKDYMMISEYIESNPDSFIQINLKEF
ncbi:MAG: transposase, partial [Oscillospiraceae bacterium]